MRVYIWYSLLRKVVYVDQRVPSKRKGGDTLFQISLDDFVIWVGNSIFETFPFSVDYAELKEDFDFVTVPSGCENEIETCVVAIQHTNEPPFLLVQQYFWPGKWSGNYTPGIIYIPETHVLFIGTGGRILTYNLVTRKRIMEVESSLVRWQRFGEYVFNESDDGLGVWSLSGEYLWSHGGDENFKYTIENGMVHVIQNDVPYSFPLDTGPSDEYR